jgi:hypothetical protein
MAGHSRDTDTTQTPNPNFSEPKMDNYVTSYVAVTVAAYEQMPDQLAAAGVAR